jgi:hypothetical protein
MGASARRIAAKLTFLNKDLLTQNRNVLVCCFSCCFISIVTSYSAIDAYLRNELNLELSKTVN